MNISFLDSWRKRHRSPRGLAVHGAGRGHLGYAGHPEEPDDADDPPGAEESAGVTQLLSECELLRAQAALNGVVLDDSVGSLEALDQLLPRWRDDPESLDWLGNDAGLYLGTVIVRTVPGARWRVWPNGLPVVRLVTGRTLDVVTAGQDWASDGTPELTQTYAEAAES